MSRHSVTQCPNCGAKVEISDLYCPNCNCMLGVQASSEELSGAIHSLEQENRELRRQLWKVRRRPSRLVGGFLSVLGLTALAASILYESNILAFIGLGLTFWGVLLFFVRPANYVRSELMEAMARAYYDSIQRLLTHLDYKGDPIYLPPRRLRALRVGVVFIGADNSRENMESILSQDIPENELFTPEPQGICVVAPGLDLANLLETEMERDFSRVDLDYLQRNLPAAIIEGFELAEGIEMEVEGDEIVVKIRNSIYESFYGESLDDRIKRLGCPLVSSIALALTRAMGQPIIIQEIRSEPENNTIIVTYRVLGRAAG